jgi:hypothetical protein
MFSTWFIPRYYKQDHIAVPVRSKTVGVESWWLVAEAVNSSGKKDEVESPSLTAATKQRKSRRDCENYCVQ